MTDQPSGDDGEASHRSASEQLDSFRDLARMDDAGIFNGTTWDSVRHLPFKAAYYDCFQMYEDDTLYPPGCFATLAEVEVACHSFIDVNCGRPVRWRGLLERTEWAAEHHRDTLSVRNAHMPFLT